MHMTLSVFARPQMISAESEHKEDNCDESTEEGKKNKNLNASEGAARWRYTYFFQR